LIFKKASIKQVAQAAGVSTQTISRVLNERPDVARETRARVWKVIDELDYHPSTLARSMICRRSFNIGVITGALSISRHSQILDAITAEADRLGYSLLLKTVPVFESVMAGTLLHSMMDHHVDGIILVFPEIAEKTDWLVDFKLACPIIFLSSDSVPGHTTISMDNYMGAYLAATHLIDLGFTEIGHISGPLGYWEARERKRGWLAALRDAGRFPSENAIVECDGSASGGFRAAAQLFSQYPTVDSILAFTDRAALGIYLQASLLGRKVSKDLGVIGFEDDGESAYFCPPLTTISHKYQVLGQTAVQRLVGMIENWDAPGVQFHENVIIQPHLLVRESTCLGSESLESSA
jgi:DNA-binding LacI/PurR family transcriptional regulator